MEDLHARWKHRWLTPKAKTISSKIHGLGTGAVEKIKKGEIIRVVAGVVVPKKDIDEYTARFGSIALQVNDEFFIAPTSREELDVTGVINHSCDPNMGWLDSVTYVALRDIEKGEELTIDYAFSQTEAENKNGELFKCNCGAKNCRMIIRADDWKLKSLQEKYGDYFSPYLKRKFMNKA